MSHKEQMRLLIQSVLISIGGSVSALILAIFTLILFEEINVNLWDVVPYGFVIIGLLSGVLFYIKKSKEKLSIKKVIKIVVIIITSIIALVAAFFIIAFMTGAFMVGFI